jgi:hypothetical protein
MEAYRNDPGVAPEVLVGGEDHPMPGTRRRADEEIGWRTLYPGAPALISKAGGLFIIGGCKRLVGKGA